MPRLTRHSYNDFELVHRVNRRGVVSRKIPLIVALTAVAISNPWAIVYNSEASILQITCLHLIKD